MFSSYLSVPAARPVTETSMMLAAVAPPPLMSKPSRYCVLPAVAAKGAGLVWAAPLAPLAWGAMAESRMVTDMRCLLESLEPGVQSQEPKERAGFVGSRLLTLGSRLLLVQHHEGRNLG